MEIYFVALSPVGLEWKFYPHDVNKVPLMHFQSKQQADLLNGFFSIAGHSGRIFVTTEGESAPGSGLASEVYSYRSPGADLSMAEG